MKMSRHRLRIFASTGALLARVADGAPTVEWERVFGGAASDGGAVVGGKDGSLFLCGYSLSDASAAKTSPQQGGWDLWLVEPFKATNRTSCFDSCLWKRK
jgi:hypothetical protein